MNREYFIARASISKHMLAEELEKKKEWSIPSNCFLFKRINSNGATCVVMVKINGHTLQREVIKKSILDNLGLSINDLPDYSLYKQVKKSFTEWFYHNVNLRLRYEFIGAKSKSDEFFDFNCGKAYLFRREVYEEYLSSHEWQEKRMECFAHHGAECLDCGANATDVHHQNYDNLCDEDVKKDLVPLCSICHKTRHAKNDYYGRLLEHRISEISYSKRFIHKEYGLLSIDSFSCGDEITQIPFIEFTRPDGKLKTRLAISSRDILEFLK